MWVEKECENDESNHCSDNSFYTFVTNRNKMIVEKTNKILYPAILFYGLSFKFISYSVHLLLGGKV